MCSWLWERRASSSCIAASAREDWVNQVMNPGSGTAGRAWRFHFDPMRTDNPFEARGPGTAQARPRLSVNQGGRALLLFLLALVGSVSPVLGAGHQHINAGALGSEPGTRLSFLNGDRFAAESGYVLPCLPVSSGPHAGLFRGSVTFTALASTSDYGGPAFGHAAPGAHLELGIETVEGPVGGSLGFWEGEEGEAGGEGGQLSVLLPVGTALGLFRFPLSETSGAAGEDPYGHIHGRVFTLDRPGLYTVGFRIHDVSGNGPGGGPLHPASDLFRLHLQSGVSLAGIRSGPDGVRLSFAALSGGRYTVERSGRLGVGAVWESVGEPVVGDDRLHEVLDPTPAGIGFYRLRWETP